MCAQTDRLSDRQLKAVKSEDKDYVLTDGDGLQLRARINRSMQWNFNYRHPVTKNRINMALGSYPEVSLAQARRKAVDAREVLARGIDPKAQRNDLAQAKLAETEHTSRANTRKRQTATLPLTATDFQSTPEEESGVFPCALHQLTRAAVTDRTKAQSAALGSTPDDQSLQGHAANPVAHPKVRFAPGGSHGHSPE